MERKQPALATKGRVANSERKTRLAIMASCLGILALTLFFALQQFLDSQGELELADSAADSPNASEIKLEKPSVSRVIAPDSLDPNADNIAAKSAEATPAKSDPETNPARLRVAIRGRVLGPDKAPLAKAQLGVFEFRGQAPIKRAHALVLTNQNGEFKFPAGTFDDDKSYAIIAWKHSLRPETIIRRADEIQKMLHFELEQGARINGRVLQNGEGVDPEDIMPSYLRNKVAAEPSPGLP